MAFIDGFVNGVPARIPDNFIALWPDVYSAEPSGTADATTADATPTPDADPAPTDPGAATARPSRKDTK